MICVVLIFCKKPDEELRAIMLCRQSERSLAVEIMTSRSRSSPTIYSKSASVVSHHFSAREFVSTEPVCQLLCAVVV